MKPVTRPKIRAKNILLGKSVVIFNRFLTISKIIFCAPFNFISSRLNNNIVWITCVLEFCWVKSVHILWKIRQRRINKRTWDFMEHDEVCLVKIHFSIWIEIKKLQIGWLQIWLMIDYSKSISCSIYNHKNFDYYPKNSTRYWFTCYIIFIVEVHLGGKNVFFWNIFYNFLHFIYI